MALAPKWIGTKFQVKKNIKTLRCTQTFRELPLQSHNSHSLQQYLVQMWQKSVINIQRPPAFPSHTHTVFSNFLQVTERGRPCWRKMLVSALHVLTNARLPISPMCIAIHLYARSVRCSVCALGRCVFFCFLKCVTNEVREENDLEEQETCRVLWMKTSFQSENQSRTDKCTHLHSAAFMPFTVLSRAVSHVIDCC